MKIFYSTVLTILFAMAGSYAHGQLWKQYADSAKIFYNQKDFEKAIEYFIKAKQELPNDSLLSGSYGKICVELGRLNRSVGRYQTSLQYYEEARQIFEKQYGRESLDYIGSINGLGILYRILGQYGKAESFYIEAKQITEKIYGREDPQYANCCNNLGVLYMYLGRYDKAEQVLLEAKEIREKFYGKEHSEYAGSCTNLGLLYQYMGLYKRAEFFLKECLNIIEKTLGKDDPKYPQGCNNLAVIYDLMGKYEEAEPLYSEAERTTEKLFGKEHPRYAECCNNLAALYSDMGNYEKAETLYLVAKDIWQKVVGKEHNDYATCCSNLASVYLSLKNYEKAESLFLEAKGIREKILTKENRDYALICDNLAVLYTKTEQFKRAESLCSEAKNIREKTLGKEHPEYATNCLNLGFLYGKIGRYYDAEQLYSEGRSILEKVLGKEHPEYISALQELANLSWANKKPEKAFAFFAEAFTIRNEQVKKIFQFTSEEEKFLFLKKISDPTDEFLSFNATTSFHSDIGLSYDVALSNRNLTLSSSQQLRQAIYTASDTNVKSVYNNWISTREQISFWQTKPIAERPDYVNSLETQANTLEKNLTRLSSSFKKGHEQIEINWKDIQKHLKSNEAAIEFVNFHFYNGQRVTDSTYYFAILLTGNMLQPEFIPLFESRQLSKLLGTGNTLTTVAILYNYANKANNAFSLIWRPIEKYLRGITRIYFAPAGVLHRICFAALPMSNNKILSDKYQFIQLNTTASVVNQTDRTIDSSDNIYLYGGIQYDADSSTLKKAVDTYAGTTGSTFFVADENTRGSSWTYLPGTEKEINEIRNLGKQEGYPVSLIKETKATEESLKALNGKASPTVLHIATHGFFFPDSRIISKDSTGRLSGKDFKPAENPLFRAGLLFAGGNNGWRGKHFEGLEDGILTAYEVSNLYLPNTKLVVLSACETGLGDIQGNEGVYGLQRAFKMAGVENLVMSLWKVPDNTTAEFMQGFYKNIFNKQSINDAFYNAQSMMKNKYRKQPYKWAAWILVR